MHAGHCVALQSFGGLVRNSAQYTESIGSPVASKAMARQQGMLVKSLELTGFRSQLVVIEALPQNFPFKIKTISTTKNMVNTSHRRMATASTDLLLHSQPRNFRAGGTWWRTRTLWKFAQMLSKAAADAPLSTMTFHHGDVVEENAMAAAAALLTSPKATAYSKPTIARCFLTPWPGRQFLISKPSIVDGWQPQNRKELHC